MNLFPSSFWTSWLVLAISLPLHDAFVSVTRTPTPTQAWNVIGPLHAVADVAIQRGCQFYSIHYDFVTRRDSTNKAPIVVLHGGPGVPSNYLRPLEDTITDRSFLFWDQLGCGQSDRPDFDERLYSIDLFVDDLVQLLQETGLNDPDASFHLYGQSFGGILAFEYLKRERPDNCLSVVLSSTPTDVAQVEAEADRLVQQLRNASDHDDDDDDDDGGDSIAEAFRKAHQVQTESQPTPLQEAYANAGTAFRGTTAIADYRSELDDEESTLDTPVLILRGERDFVTPKCIKGWTALFQNAKTMELAGCAHHGLLEKPNDYGAILNSFWQEHET